MPFDVGFNFRATSGYVTDGSGETYIIGTDTYPTTRTVNGSSVTFGLSAGTWNPRDRVNTVDRRFAGAHFVNSGTSATFRVDLPATGTYEVHAGFGDAGAGAPSAYFEFFDNATSLFAKAQTALLAPAKEIMDAAGNKLGDGATNFDGITKWIASETLKSFSFASTILLLKVYQPSSGQSYVNHLRVVQVSAGAKPADYYYQAASKNVF